jgi:hypothetical protein
VRIRPRMETRPVNGHFLSVEERLVSLLFVAILLDRSPGTNVRFPSSKVDNLSP